MTSPPATAARFHCGRIAIIGRPNVGKSTLVNALVGARVSIVSQRPQTTRHRLLGIASVPHGQLLLVDTPGLHREQESALNRVLNRAARGALDGIDAAVLVVRAGQWGGEDEDAFSAARAAKVPLVLAVNQIDRCKDKSALLPYLQQVAAGRDWTAVHPLSALKRTGLDALTQTLTSLVPEQPPLYAEDDMTDKSQRFLAAERVREQLLRQLGAELPYAATVEIESFSEQPARDGGMLLRIGAVIWVERESQKAIVIGKGGARLKSIGQKAREQMERLFGAKVFLQTWVRARAGWSDDETALRALGYAD